MTGPTPAPASSRKRGRSMTPNDRERKATWRAWPRRKCPLRRSRWWPPSPRDRGRHIWIGARRNAGRVATSMRLAARAWPRSVPYRWRETRRGARNQRRPQGLLPSAQLPLRAARWEDPKRAGQHRDDSRSHGNPGCLARLFPVGLELDLVRFARFDAERLACNRSIGRSGLERTNARIDEKRLRERRGSDGLT